jgi:(+)-pinoresinol hydroxylase
MNRAAVLIAAMAAFASPASADNRAATPAAAPSGKQVFQRWCSACHAPGARSPGTTALAAKYNGEQPAELEKRTDLTPETVAYFVRNGVSIMPSFRKTEISDAELAALGTYLSRQGKKK